MSIIVCRFVEVCVFRFVNDRHEYLMLKRSPDEKIYPNIWQFVTGSLHEEEQATKAALRELTEETGLSPKRLWVVPHVNTFYDPAYDAVNMNPLFAVEVSAADEPALSSEHCAYEWLPFAEARLRLVWPGQRQGLEVIEEYVLGGEEAGVLTQVPL